MFSLSILASCLAVAGGGEAQPVLPRTTSTPLLLPLAPLNHGPSTTGGGSSTESGETLKKGAFAIVFSTEVTTYDSVSREEAEAIATTADEFDSIDRTFVQNVALAYGVSDDFELGLQLGYYRGSNFIDAEFDGVTAESSSADPAGLTDTWVTAKTRVMRGAGGHLSILAGIKLPTGDDDDTLANFEPLEPSSQAGSGSVDYRLGVAYSRYLTPRVTLDAGGSYTLRTKHDGFAVGDRFTASTALAYRLSEDVRAPNNWSLFGELSTVWLDHDEADGVENENSGGTVLYLTAGARNRINEHLSISLAPSIPIAQDVNGEQVEVDARFSLTIGVSL